MHWLYLSGTKSSLNITKELGMNETNGCQTIRFWAKTSKENGVMKEEIVCALTNLSKKVVKEYLEGKCSTYDLMSNMAFLQDTVAK